MINYTDGTSKVGDMASVLDELCTHPTNIHSVIFGDPNELKEQVDLQELAQRVEALEREIASRSERIVGGLVIPAGVCCNHD